MLENVTESFEIDESNIEKELCGVGRELAFFGGYTADLKANAATKRLELEAYDAQLALDIRKNPDEKITEGYVKERIKADPKHIELATEVIESEKQLNKADNYFRAHAKRADCIIAIAYKQRTELKHY